MNRLFYLLIVISLCSCDEVFDDIFYVQNNTNSELCIKIKTKNPVQNDTLIIDKGNLQLIYNAHSAGGKTQYRIPVSNVFDEFLVSMDDKISGFDYYNDSNWIYTITSENSADYIIVIDSTHFR